MLKRLKEKLNFIIQSLAAKLESQRQKLQEQAESRCRSLKSSLQTLLAVAKIQCAMRYMRLRRTAAAAADAVSRQLRCLADRADAAAHAYAERLKLRYATCRQTWHCNQHFTFWLIPASGQNIARANVHKKQIKYVLTGMLSFLFIISVTIGVLAHFAIQSESQKQELAEYRAAKKAQEQTIQELQKIAESNQKQLAYLAKLEDKVRSEMAKNGTELPPKTDSSAFAGKGGPTLGDSSPMGFILEQEKNIHNEAKAKQADLEQLLNVIETENYRREMTPSQWPTEGGEITSYFGGRANPFDGYSSDWHPGIDIANYYGAPVYASASGYVQQAGWYGGYGRYIRLSHDYGFITAYAHMSRLAVNSGDYVRKGQIIGYVGSSGYSTGPHLHFELLHYGRQLNPLNYI